MSDFSDHSGRRGRDGHACRTPRRPMLRLARLFLGRNELRRPCDRVEGLLVVALSAAFVAAAVIAAVLAGHIYQSQRAQAAGSRPAAPVTARPGGPVVDAAARPAAVYDARTATPRPLGLDRPGGPPALRLGTPNFIVDALIADIIITADAAVVLILCYKLCRLALDRHRLARWESAWAATGPQWTRRP